MQISLEVDTADLIDNSENAWKLLEAAIAYLADDAQNAPADQIMAVVKILLTK